MASIKQHGRKRIVTLPDVVRRETWLTAQITATRRALQSVKLLRRELKRELAYWKKNPTASETRQMLRIVTKRGKELDELENLFFRDLALFRDRAKKKPMKRWREA